MVEAKRLFSKKEGQRSESLSLLFMFEKVVHKKVQMGFLAFIVRVCPTSFGGFHVQKVTREAQR